MLQERELLFRSFFFRMEDGAPRLLGTGAFSCVYEVYQESDPANSYALKVEGFGTYTVSSAQFWNSGRLQWILSQESDYIVRALDAKELLLRFDGDGRITEVKNPQGEAWAEESDGLLLRFTLMERLEPLLEKDLFGNHRLTPVAPQSEEEVLKYALEMAQAVAAAHQNRFLHRDIKIENTFYDPLRSVYKLGDFGISKRVENGTAETVLFTNGYGAPEIERRLDDHYDAAADIYSFGITLYLLLNDLKFPGSDGYYCRAELQYSPDFVFPAPVHASAGMVRVIRKMCSYYAKDRYRTMNEVLEALSALARGGDTAFTEELAALTEAVTETVQEYADEDDADDEFPDGMGRLEHKELLRYGDIIYRMKCVKYFCLLAPVMMLCLKGQRGPLMLPGEHWLLLLPFGLILESLLQRIREFHIFFGALLAAVVVIGAAGGGIGILQVVVILCVILGQPALSAASGFGMLLWFMTEALGWFGFLRYLRGPILRWLFPVAAVVVLVAYFRMYLMWSRNGWYRRTMEGGSRGK